MILIISILPRLDAPRCGLGLFDPVPRKINSIMNLEIKFFLGLTKMKILTFRNEILTEYILTNEIHQQRCR